MAPSPLYTPRNIGALGYGTPNTISSGPDEKQNSAGEGATPTTFPLSVLEILTFFAGLVGNQLILSVSRKLKTAKELLISNLALADLVGLLTIPFQAQVGPGQRWALPHFLCTLCPYLQVLSVNVSVFTVMAIAADLYRAVLCPRRVHACFRVAAVAILFIRFAGLLLTFSAGLDYKVTYMEGGGELEPICTNHGMTDGSRNLTLFRYFPPLIFSMGAIALVVAKLWRSTHTHPPGNQEELGVGIVVHPKRKAVKMFMIFVSLFTLCWLPVQIYNFLQPLISPMNRYEYVDILWLGYELAKVPVLLALTSDNQIGDVEPNPPIPLAAW